LIVYSYVKTQEIIVREGQNIGENKYDKDIDCYDNYSVRDNNKSVR